MSMKPVCNQPRECSSVSPTLGVEYIIGGVGEWLKPAVLKTVRLERVSGVRIPPPPPDESYVEVTEIFLSLKDAGAGSNSR